MVHLYPLGQRIQENGVGSGDVSALGEDHGVPLDPLAADKIEVVRGPMSSLYGSDAMGGVVNIITNQPSTDAIAAKGLLQFGEKRAAFSSTLISACSISAACT